MTAFEAGEYQFACRSGTACVHVPRDVPAERLERAMEAMKERRVAWQGR